jgi:hypothetical protein
MVLLLAASGAAYVPREALGRTSQPHRQLRASRFGRVGASVLSSLVMAINAALGVRPDTCTNPPADPARILIDAAAGRIVVIVNPSADGLAAFLV